jgi:hypothetical protein
MRSEKEVRAMLKVYDGCTHQLCSTAESFEEENIADILRWVLGDKTKKSKTAFAISCLPKKVFEGIQLDIEPDKNKEVFFKE